MLAVKNLVFHHHSSFRISSQSPHSRFFSSGAFFKNKSQTSSLTRLALQAIFCLALYGYCKDKDETRSLINEKQNENDLKHYKKIKKLKNTEIIFNTRRDSMLDLMERAEKIKELFCETHYIFLHAQTNALLPVIELINLLAEEKNAVKHPYFKYLRVNDDTNYVEGKQLKSNWLNKITTFLVKKGVMTDHAPTARDFLISVDPYFGLSNRYEGESAIKFLESNRSVCLTPFNHSIKKLVLKILLNDGTLRKKSIDKIASEIFIIANKISYKKLCGNLCVICIPKDLFAKKNSDLKYRAHCLGKECNCYDDDLVILNEVQNNNIKNAACKLESQVLPPQYRINTTLLDPRYGMYTFMLTAICKQERKILKEKIKNLLEAEDQSYVKKLVITQNFLKNYMDNF